MEESAIKVIKDMESLELNDRDAAVRNTGIIFSDISVEGYDTSLPKYAVELTLRKCFASCGKVLVVRVIKRLSVVLMRFPGGDAKDKALALDGTDVGGWIPIVKATLWQSYPFGSCSSVPSNLRCMLFVSGYDTGLAEFDIQIALCKHFSSCGEVTRVGVLPSGRASIMIEGERCEEKALHLNGSFMGGMKLLVEPPKEHSGPRKFASRKTTGYTQPSPSVLLAKKKIKKELERQNMEMKKIQKEIQKEKGKENMEMKKIQKEMKKEKGKENMKMKTIQKESLEMMKKIQKENMKMAKKNMIEKKTKPLWF